MFNENFVITENYFGRELTPMEIIQTETFTVYVCVDSTNDIQVYNENGEGACELSNIDINEFIAVLATKS